VRGKALESENHTPPSIQKLEKVSTSAVFQALKYFSLAALRSAKSSAFAGCEIITRSANTITEIAHRFFIRTSSHHTFKKYKNRKPSITLGDLYDVTLGSSAVFENQNPNEVPKKSRNRGQDESFRPVAFRPHLTVGLALCQIEMI
jgi:hypothetical protein